MSVITKDDLVNTFINENVIDLLKRELEYIEDGSCDYYSVDDLYDIADDKRIDGCITMYTRELESKFKEDFYLDEILDFVNYFREEYEYKNINMHNLEIILTEEYLGIVLSDNDIHEMDYLKDVLTTQEQVEYMLYKSLDSLNSLDETYEDRFTELRLKIEESEEYTM